MTLMLKDLWPENAPDPRTYGYDEEFGSTFFGIEVEMENSHLQHGKYWEVKGDGSLRNAGQEAVFRMPLCGTDVRQALDEFDTLGDLATVTTGMRTSVHVHMDVRDLPLSKIANLIVLYAALESVIYSANGSKDRYSNIYCPGITSNDQASSLRKFVKHANASDISSIHDSILQSQKYSGLNIAAMRTFGSVEFRMHRGTTSSAELKEFLLLLRKLRDAAVAYGSTDDVVLDAMHSNSSYASKILGNEYNDIYAMYYYNNICNAVYIANYIIFNPTCQQQTPSVSTDRQELINQIRSLLTT